MNKARHKTRIALVITELDVGGAELCLANLASGLDRQRFDPVVFVLGPAPVPPRDGLVTRLEEADVPVDFLGFASKWGLISAVRKLRGKLKQAAPHIVQSMLFHANVATRLALAGKPSVVWCAGIRVADPSWMRQAVERRAVTRAQRVVCVSQMVADFAALRMGIAREKLVVIPNGVDVDALRSRTPADLSTLGLPASRRAITCIARLSPQKGIDQLLLAAPRILDALPHHDLLLVGDGPQSAELHRLAAETGMADRIHFCGWQPNVGAILLASDLLVLPSRWEGMPNVLLEAMACSLPVVCTRVEGVVEVLGPLAELQTVPVQQPQVLAEKVVKIISESSRARDLSRANWQRVVDSFSLPYMLQRYDDLYQNVSRAPLQG